MPWSSSFREGWCLRSLRSSLRPDPQNRGSEAAGVSLPHRRLSHIAATFDKGWGRRSLWSRLRTVPIEIVLWSGER